MEALTRLRRNQVFGTLLLFLTAVLVLPYFAEFSILLVPSPSPLDTSILASKLLVFIGLGYFVGFVLDQVVGTAGQRLTGFLCAKVLRKSKRREFERQDEDLESALREEKKLLDITTGRASIFKFHVAAKYLSQEKFRDFPELSPFNNIDRASTYSVAALLFAFLGGMGLVGWLLGQVQVIHAAYDRGWWLVLGVSIGLSGLLWAHAKSQYEEGRRGTIISLREKIEQDRLRRLQVHDKAEGVEEVQVDRNSPVSDGS